MKDSPLPARALIGVTDLAAGVTTLVSVSTNGGAANGTSRVSVITPDGRCMAFVSAASNLAPATYQVQFITNLNNPRWQPVTNAVQIIGTEGYLLDPAPNDSQRFYRVIESGF